MISSRSKKPFINIWFGNFYCPAYDDKDFVDQMMGQIAQLGFTDVMLDAKAWEDFRDRYETGALSPYVEMQEYMQQSAKKHGLGHNFLALYLNGDNLYPRIRFSPPIFGEEIINREGRPGHWYKYWSEYAQLSMVNHVQRLMKRYGQNYTCCLNKGKEVLPLCSMWDPVAAMSFDQDGRNRYVAYLKRIYKGDIQRFNEAYQTGFYSFEELEPKDYWFTFSYDKTHPFGPEDIKKASPRFYMWRDNAFWKMEELKNYFKAMQEKLKKIDDRIFLFPGMTQWGYFLNVDGNRLVDQDADFSDLWDTAVRGIDIYALADYVDCCHFLTVPVTPDGKPDPYAVSCQHSMMRVMNEGKTNLGGIYWGRFLYQDVYEFLTPCELIGVMAAAGVEGYSSYGINGLDDGGVLNRMDESFLKSLKTGNEWLARVIPLRKGDRKKEAALLFPSAMAGIEPFEVEGNKIRRLDLLGWYRLLCDLGYQVDVIDKGVVKKGGLASYKILVLPSDDCYCLCADKELEEKIREWTQKGGALLHGPEDALCENVFGIKGEDCPRQPYQYDVTIIAQGNCFQSYSKGEVLARYVNSRRPCVVKNKMGEGAVYSFGVQMGASYACQNIPHVPYDQKNAEMYPLILSGTKLFEAILSAHCRPERIVRGRNIETGEFENGCFIINHSSAPLKLPHTEGKKDFQYPVGGDILLPRSAVWICKKMN